MGRLRKLAAARRGTSHDDLWQSLQITMSALDADHPGIPALGLKPLGSFLWSPDSMPDLGSAGIENRHLLAAVRSLSLVRDVEAKAVRQVDYRNLGTRELGSVYESLLELHPEINVDARTFGLESAAGAERKLTGSYYTPESLIERLLDEALDPILDEAEHSSDPEQALLDLRVLDPACGSGHFLISAAHRIAGRLASVRVGGIEPTPADLRTAVRDVIGRCLYGIDINPMAANSARSASGSRPTTTAVRWASSTTTSSAATACSAPLPNSSLTASPRRPSRSSPGTTPKWLAHLRKTNLPRAETAESTDVRPRLVRRNGPHRPRRPHGRHQPRRGDHHHRRRRQGGTLQRTCNRVPAYTRSKLAADAWCAAFVTPKTPDHPPITDSTVRAITEGHHLPPEYPGSRPWDLADEYQFLHPHIAFPDIFMHSGGFDVVVGNPPWDQVEFKDDPRETFAAKATQSIARARTMSDTERELIAELVSMMSLRRMPGDYVAGKRTPSWRNSSTVLHAFTEIPTLYAGVGRLNTATRCSCRVDVCKAINSPGGRVGDDCAQLGSPQTHSPQRYFFNSV